MNSATRKPLQIALAVMIAVGALFANEQLALGEQDNAD